MIGDRRGLNLGSVNYCFSRENALLFRHFTLQFVRQIIEFSK
jgi:hypothetical protein